MMNDFLIASNVRSSVIVSEAMGKGIGVDKGHVHEKEAKPKPSLLSALCQSASPLPTQKLSAVTWLAMGAVALLGLFRTLDNNEFGAGRSDLAFDCHEKRATQADYKAHPSQKQPLGLPALLVLLGKTEQRP